MEKEMKAGTAMPVVEAITTRQKHPGGRPKKAVKRTRQTGIRFTTSEYFIVKQKAIKAGLGITVYLRQIAIKGQVTARFTEEEKQWIRQLAGMANNLNQLAKKAHQEGLNRALRTFESCHKEIDELLQRTDRKQAHLNKI